MRTLKIIQNDEILSSAFTYVIKNSTSLDLPYHHLHHNLVVFRSCWDFIQSEEGDHSYPIFYTYGKEIYIAALFHDFNHSGGKLPDDKNVKIAIQGFSTWYNLCGYEDKIDYNKVISIIKATQYPYVELPEDADIEELLIRDADLSTTFKDTFLQFNVLGLSKEMNIPLKKMAAGEITFLNSIKFNLPYFENIWMEMKYDLLEEQDYLTAILNDDETTD